MTELIIIGAFALSLVVCLLSGVSILYALVFGYILFFLYGLRRKKTAAEVLRMSLDGIKTVSNVLITFGLIGIITALWRISGTIPYIVYYATGFCTPHIMVPLSFLICCLVSFLTGTSFGTAATVGVICMTMCDGMGVSTLITGGAILSGVFFGDRCSPMSTSALLVAELTKTDIFRNIRIMVKTSLVPFAFTCAVYAAAGLSGGAAGASDAVRPLLRAGFELHWTLLIPAVIVIIFSLFKVNVKITMSVSILAAAVSALVTQHAGALELLKSALTGFHPQDAGLDAVIGGGGMLSMARVFAIICISSCYSAIFDGTGFLDGIKEHIDALGRKSSPFAATLAVSILSGLVACNQTLTIMLTHQLCRGLEKDDYALASHLENTAVIVSPLVPWSIAGAVPLEAIGAPTVCLLFACYLYLIPLWGLVTNRKIRVK